MFARDAVESFVRFALNNRNRRAFRAPVLRTRSASPSGIRTLYTRATFPLFVVHYTLPFAIRSRTCVSFMGNIGVSINLFYITETSQTRRK